MRGEVVYRCRIIMITSLLLRINIAYYCRWRLLSRARRWRYDAMRDVTPKIFFDVACRSLDARPRHVDAIIRPPLIIAYLIDAICHAGHDA